MVSKTVEVKNVQGIHMRPAGMLVAEMKKFPGCTVMLNTADKKAKATAVMQIMAAGIKCGTQVKITADGDKGPHDAKNVPAAAFGRNVQRCVELFESGFGE